MTVLFKACPRCAGDLQRGEDMYGQYDKCIQCGHRVEAIGESAYAINRTAEKAVRKTKETVKADAA